MDATQLTLDEIKCPNCGHLIPVSETIFHEISERARQQLNAEAANQATALSQREEALLNRETNLDNLILEKMKAAREELENKIFLAARQELTVELEDLKRQTAEKEKKLKQAQEIELTLRASNRELAERNQTTTLDLERQLDEERQKIREDTSKRVYEEHRLKDAEKEKKLQDAIRANEVLRRKLEQGSQQAQGEVLELDIANLVAAAFPTDQITQVPTGVAGADILQQVFSKNGHNCGTIVWETKRTKAWNEGWIQKLKDDQRTTKADLAILVSEVLPKDCNNFREIKGVWVVNPQCAVNLAAALRLVLTEVAHSKLAAVGKNEKMEWLYKYLSGSEFKQRVEAIVESFVTMQQDLEEERRSTERRWAKREKQIQRVISNTSGMYGDLQGLIGSSLQSIPLLTNAIDGSD